MFNILFRALDPRHLEVLFHRSRYINHIFPSHPLVKVDDVREAIVDPDLITVDVASDEIECYYRQEIMIEYPELYLKVCVLFKPSYQGRVITAFFVDWPKPEEEIIWQK